MIAAAGRMAPKILPMLRGCATRAQPEGCEAALSLIKEQVQQQGESQFRAGLARFKLPSRLISGIRAQMRESEIGESLLTHKSVTGPMTQRIVAYTPETVLSGEFEPFFYNHLPSCVALRARYGVFQTEIQRIIDGWSQTDSGCPRVLASIPCGVMGLLASLRYKIPNYRLVGLDSDETSLTKAAAVLRGAGHQTRFELRSTNALEMTTTAAYDLIESHGLNVYFDDRQVAIFYRNLYQALVPGGVLVISYSPPSKEWDHQNVDLVSLAFQKVLFMDVIQAKWLNSRTWEQTQAQLQAAGFSIEKWVSEGVGILPTVIARKPPKTSAL